jgi:hypothetical protein
MGSVRVEMQLERKLVTNRDPMTFDRWYRGLDASRRRDAVTDERCQVHAHSRVSRRCTTATRGHHTDAAGDRVDVGGELVEHSGVAAEPAASQRSCEGITRRIDRDMQRVGGQASLPDGHS